jgi:acyl dehydratase
MRIFRSLDELSGAVGEEMGPSPWMSISQQHVDMFAEATGDHQWIHVDVARAAAGPFGGTIAHGYLTLALIPVLASELFHLDLHGPKLNYGVNRVRFPHVVPVGSNVRARATIAEVTDVPAGKQMVTRYVIELEDAEKPACVAETVVLLLDD